MIEILKTVTFWQWYSIIVAVLVVGPYVFFMLDMIKKTKFDSEKSQYYSEESLLRALSQKEKTVQELAYNAIGYAVEQRGKATKSGCEIDVLSSAVEHMRRKFDISEQEAVDAVESILGKVEGQGASGKDRVKK